MQLPNSIVNILLVEDDMVDILHIEYGLRKHNVNYAIEIAKCGKDALDKIYSETTIYLPEIIILDINMPKMNGFEFLKKIQMDYRLNKVPTIIVTASNAQRDKDMAKTLNVAGFFTKPLDFDKFLDLFHKLLTTKEAK